MVRVEYRLSEKDSLEVELRPYRQRHNKRPVVRLKMPYSRPPLANFLAVSQEVKVVA